MKRAAGRAPDRTPAVARDTGRQDGQALVELALMLPVLALILLGILDLGRVFTTFIALANAAREGARYCALHPGDTPGTRARVAGELDGRVAADTSATACAAGAPGDSITVTVAGSFTPLTPYVSKLIGGPITMQAPATMVVW